MKYFLPDSQDLVDPSFDFTTERRSVSRLRHRDDQYAHELFSDRLIDGLLVSKGIVDGYGNNGARYTLAQRHRLLRVGAHEYFRTSQVAWGPLPILGDCGGFTYVKEKVPPYTAEQVLDFYVECGFDMGISVDHVILAYDTRYDDDLKSAPTELVERQEITLELADQFLRAHKKRRATFEPLGAAQGWSPKSYAHSLTQLEKMGYRYVAVGGMVPLKTSEILASLAGMEAVRGKKTKLHLLGVTRTESIPAFARCGVVSFDSTSPLRQAFKDDKDNYYTMDRQYTALRIPQVEGNPSLQKAIASGRVPQDKARKLERAARDAMCRFDDGQLSVDGALNALLDYEALYDPRGNHAAVYRETLEDRPWKTCSCDVCATIGHHVILFRGAERNRRRGLHNTWMFYRRLKRELEVAEVPNKRLVQKGALAK